MRKNEVTFIQSYTAFSWVISLRVKIDNTDEAVTQQYNTDHTDLKWKAYLNESSKDEEITAVTVKTD